MDDYSKKKLREATGKMRQGLEEYFQRQSVDRQSAEYKAWRYMMLLAVEKTMEARNISGQLPPFLTLAGAGGDDPPAPDVVDYCRGLFASDELRFDLSSGSDPFAAADILGWLHQYWHDGERQAITASANKDQYAKIVAEKVVSRTQVYSEKYMIDFLLQNTLGALWMGMSPESPQLRDWSFYVNKVPAAALSRKPVKDISVLDPACGCGNFLLAAFDMLYAMYREENPAEKPAVICAAILNNNLYGIDIDAKAVAVTRMALWVKALEKAPDFSGGDLTDFHGHIIAVDEDEVLTDVDQLGSLTKVDPNVQGSVVTDLLSRRFDVVVTNPPYIDKRDYARPVRDYLRCHYPQGTGNLYAAFILRCKDLAQSYVGMITPQTFLFLTSYAALRRELFQQTAIRTLAHLGLGAFSDAVVDTAMFVLQKKTLAGSDSLQGVYFKLLEAPNKEQALLAALAGCTGESRHEQVFCCSQQEVTALEGSPVTYWLGAALRKVVTESRPLRDYADIVLGMKTSDNRRFVRAWWEVEPEESGRSPAKWAPYEKEASGYRYQRNSAHFVRWTSGAQDYYKNHYSAQLPNAKYWFKPGIVYGLISSKAFTAKLLPAGHMADMAASCVFPHDSADSNFFLGLLNSKIYQWLLKLLNPTVNYQPIDLQRLPVPELAPAVKDVVATLATSAAQAVGILREMEITDRNYCFEPGGFLPLAEKLPTVVTVIWFNCLQYLLTRDEIDCCLAKALQLPIGEYQAILADLGGLCSEYPGIEGYSFLPAGLSTDLFSSPHNCLTYSSEEITMVKARLRELYSGKWPLKMGDLPEEFFAGLSVQMKLHPLTVYHLIAEGVNKEGWRCDYLEKRLLEDFFSAVVLWLLGHRWSGGLAAVVGCEGCRVLPVSEDGGRKSLYDTVLEFISSWADTRETLKEFERIGGDSLGKWLADKFFPRHIRQFKQRPVVWQLASNSERGVLPVFSCLMHYRQAGQLGGLSADYAEPLLEKLHQQSPSLRRDAGVNELEGFIASLKKLAQYDFDWEFGIKVNIAPFQVAGLLAADVLPPAVVARAAADVKAWREDFF